MDQMRQRLQRARILVVGDAMLDRYLYGSVDRISPEAPVPVVRVTRRCYVVLAVYLGKTRLIDNMLVEPVGDELRVEV